MYRTGVLTLSTFTRLRFQFTEEIGGLVRGYTPENQMVTQSGCELHRKPRNSWAEETPRGRDVLGTRPRCV